tara:strand:- start:32 stop:391 length:360 start_codon:yes stop_codon:yes gene_type:complete
MPIRPKQFCITGCGNYAIKGSRRCDSCGVRENKEVRRIKFYGNASQQGYDHQWSKVSKLVRRQEPICRRCKRNVPSMVDHIIPLRQGGERLALDNLQPLCNSCHVAKTKEDVLKYGDVD